MVLLVIEYKQGSETQQEHIECPSEIDADNAQLDFLKQAKRMGREFINAVLVRKRTLA